MSFQGYPPANDPNLRIPFGGLPAQAVLDSGGNDPLSVVAAAAGTRAHQGLRDIRSVKDYTTSPIGDGREYGACNITVGQNVLTSPGADIFLPTDVGKLITVRDAGATNDSLTTTVDSYQSARQITLTASAAATATGVNIAICTDATTTFLNFVADLIATGARGIIPYGKYGITSSLDFSALGNTLLGCGFIGDGMSGNDPSARSGTVLWNMQAGQAIVGYGGASSIYGLKMGGFLIRNLHLIGATNWTLFMDKTDHSEFAEIAASGYRAQSGSISTLGQGNGLWFNNMQSGQVHIRRCHAFYFNDSTNASEGIRFGSKTTGHAAAAESGNSSMDACSEVACFIGFHFDSDSFTNGCTFSSLKALSAGGVNTGIGYWLGANIRQNTFLSPHSEGYATGYYFNGAIQNIVHGALASYQAGSAGDGATAFKFDSVATGNEVDGEIDQFDIGTAFGATSGNRVRARLQIAPQTSEVTGTSSRNYYENTARPQIAEDQGQPGVIAPTSEGWYPSAFTLVANRCYFSRIWLPRDMTVNHVGFILNLAATGADVGDVGIYTLQDPTLPFNASTNKFVPIWRQGGTIPLNGAVGVTNIATGGLIMKARQIYYGAFAYGAINAVGGKIVMATRGDQNVNLLFGATPGPETGGVLTAVFPLPATLTALTASEPGSPILSLLEA